MNEIFTIVNKGNKEELLKLLNTGVDVNVQEKHGRTPLMDAVINKNTEIVRMIIQRGANVNLQDSRGLSALHFAAQNYLLDIAQILLQNQARVDIQDIHGNTPLNDAVFNSMEKGEMIKLLLAKGADKDLKNKHGVSPRQLASTIGNYNVAQFLE